MRDIFLYYNNKILIFHCSKKVQNILIKINNILLELFKI